MNNQGTYEATAPKEDAEKMKFIWNASTRRQKCSAIAMLLVSFIVYGLTFLVLPLIPVTVLCLVMVIMMGEEIKKVYVRHTGRFEEVKNTAHTARTNLIILTLYLLIAYGMIC